jgi:ribosomal protein L24
MFGHILRRGPGLGDDVTVLAGPYAGHSGRISELGADGRFRVVIDDCCQPSVASSDLRALRSTGLFDRVVRAHHVIERNPEVYYTAAMAAKNGRFRT